MITTLAVLQAGLQSLVGNVRVEAGDRGLQQESELPPGREPLRVQFHARVQKGQRM